MRRRLRAALCLLPLLAVTALVLFLSYTEGRGAEEAAGTPGGETFVTADSDGHPTTFTLVHVPERVLVTYPGAAELMIDLGISDRIVGTIAPYGKEPPVYRDGYAALPILGAPYMPSREEVTALRPDLIIGWSHHFTPDALGDVHNYFRKGIGCYVVPATVRKGHPTLDGTVYPFIEDMGRMFAV